MKDIFIFFPPSYPNFQIHIPVNLKIKNSGLNNNKCATLLGKYTQKGGKTDKAEPPDLRFQQISFDH